MFSKIQQKLAFVFKMDPAAQSTAEVVLCYSGIHAVVLHRVSHWLWSHGFKLAARWLSTVGRFLTGIEIHPGAVIGKRVLIDHGMGVVIGETTVVGDDVLIYQGVTLGGTSIAKGKRHPNIGNNVVIGSHASVLGPITVGDHCKVGSGSLVMHNVPPHCTVVGVPAKIVKTGNADDMDLGTIPDPFTDAIEGLKKRLGELEKRMS
ncbi:MAG: serine O-acetyltransferase [Deltaproteobacteria bacterium CG11_big_fil_rev_8_21_14_0_20_47_16]|nr:MAG: serine O-acetyltransferase [Deltaproteobacteria bacterium CG11_big_fil_rev_8_21_14_0_20_47_16]